MTDVFPLEVLSCTVRHVGREVARYGLGGFSLSKLKVSHGYEITDISV